MVTAALYNKIKSGISTGPLRGCFMSQTPQPLGTKCYSELSPRSVGFVYGGPARLIHKSVQVFNTASPAQKASNKLAPAPERFPDKKASQNRRIRRVRATFERGTPPP